MARHAAVDLCLVFKIQPQGSAQNRLPPKTYRVLVERLKSAGGVLSPETESANSTDVTVMESRLRELRGMYEPFVNGLGQYLSFTLPRFYPERQTADNWQTSLDAADARHSRSARRRLILPRAGRSFRLKNRPATCTRPLSRRRRQSLPAFPRSARR